MSGTDERPEVAALWAALRETGWGIPQSGSIGSLVSALAAKGFVVVERSIVQAAIDVDGLWEPGSDDGHGHEAILSRDEFGDALDALRAALAPAQPARGEADRG